MGYEDYAMSGATTSGQAMANSTVGRKEGEITSRLSELGMTAAQLTARLTALADRIAPEPRDVSEGASAIAANRPSLNETVNHINRVLAAASATLERIEAQI